MQWLNEFTGWCRSLPPAAIFFFAIPFAVAAAALLRDAIERLHLPPWHRIAQRLPSAPQSRPRG